MNVINALLTQLSDWLFAPFASHPTAGLLFWSSVTGVIMTYVFGKTSNQKALHHAADQVRAQLLAVKLFKDDLTVTMRCQVALFKATGWRLLHSMTPMFVMIVPLLLVLTQLALRYEFRPMLPGEKAVLAMHLTPDAWDQYQDITLNAPSNVTLDTESMRDAKTNTLYWRIRANEKNSSEQLDQSTKLTWKFGEQTIDKHLSLAKSSESIQPTNPIRPGVGFWDRVFYAGEPGFGADSPVKSIDIQYEPRNAPIHTPSIPLLGSFDIPWWATFFIVSMVVALIAGKFMGVQY